MFADAALLESLPNGGAVAALIVVVILFLKKQEKSEETIKAVAKLFTDEMRLARQEYREHLTSILGHGPEAKGKPK